jgi:hypothetical protein
MLEREPITETIGRGELLFLSHPNQEVMFSGYGLTVEDGRPDLLVGLIMVDRPNQADPEWLEQISELFGECDLLPMTENGDRGLVCQMQIDENSLPYLKTDNSGQASEIQKALVPLLFAPPAPKLRLIWDQETCSWRSKFDLANVLPKEVRGVFGDSGYGCMAVETDLDVVHVCHAPDIDIVGFHGKPITYRWELIKMPSAPLIRLVFAIHDRPGDPFRFESFLNVAEESQANILAQLAGQDRLYFAFYGNNLQHRFTTAVDHDEQQWQRLDEMVAEAESYWEELDENLRDYDLAKTQFFGMSPGWNQFNI